jgi:hypothetical protein
MAVTTAGAVPPVKWLPAHAKPVSSTGNRNVLMMFNRFLLRFFYGSYESIINGTYQQPGYVSQTNIEIIKEGTLPCGIQLI